MSWYVTYKLTMVLPKSNNTFLNTLKDLNIHIPDDVQIKQSSKRHMWNIVEEMEKPLPGSGYMLVNIFENSTSWIWGKEAEEMKQFSKKFPDVLFIMNCESSEDGIAIWRDYYKNGKQQHCEAKITFDDFDEAELK